MVKGNIRLSDCHLSRVEVAYLSAVQVAPGINQQVSSKASKLP